MTLLAPLALVVVVGMTLWASAIIVAHLFSERSPLITFGLAVVTATISQAFGLLWLPRILPIGWSSFVAAAILLAIAAGLRLRHRDRSEPVLPIPIPHASPTTFAALIGISVWVHISSLAFWFDGTAGGADVATLYLHSGLVATIGRGNFPVVNPFEPDYLMTYRFSVHTLAAAAQHLLNAEVPKLLPHFMGALAVGLFLGTFGIVARVTRSFGAGIFTGLLVWAWGPLYWLGLPAFAAREGVGEALALVAQDPATVTWSGVFLGPTFTMPTHNPTNIFGLFPALGSLWLVHELAAGALPSAHRRWLLLMLGVFLTVLAAASEYYFAAVAAGIVAHSLLMLWRNRRTRSWLPAAPLAALAVSGMLALTTPGVLASVFRGDRDVLQLGAYMNSSGLGNFTSWGYNAGGPLFVWSNPNQHEVGLLSWEYIVDGGLVSFFLIGIAIYCIANPRRPATAFALAGLAAMLAGTVIHLESSPADIYRFAHFGAAIGFVSLGIWGAPSIVAATRLRRLRPFVSGTVGSISLVAFLVSAIAWPSMIARAGTVGTDVDDAAIEYLIDHTDVADRLLVLWGSRTAYDLYDPRTDQITARLSAATGQFIPYGYHHLSRADEYSPIYGWAQQSLLEEQLDKLQIRFLYSDPDRTTEEQRTSLARLSKSGKIRPVLNTTNPSGESRVLYEYLPSNDRSDQ